jgi:hypothetical protein
MAITISGSGITSANIADGTIVNADINSSAAIAGTKVSGSFGKVLQVVQTVKNDTWSSNTNALTEVTGLTASLTPSSTTSKILVMIDAVVGTSYFEVNGSLYRNGSVITNAIGDANTSITSMQRRTWAGNSYQTTSQSNTYDYFQLGVTYLDSPSSTALTTYSIALDNYSSNTVYVNRSHYQETSGAYSARTVSTITLMEIGA